MSIIDDCLNCLKNKDWNGLVRIIKLQGQAENFALLPTFSVFENFFIGELIRFESGDDKDLYVAAATRIFQLHDDDKMAFKLSDKAFKQLVKYLFDRDPKEKYAKILTDEPKAKEFLEKYYKEIESKIETNRISANLNIKLGDHGNLVFAKEIFNSPQEKELFLAAKKVLPNSILLPNIALSTIINVRVCDYLEFKTASYFYKATLDLCIVNSNTFYPELFIELDSSWHEMPKNIENDKMKDEIFKVAGLQLHRLTKKKNKNMTEIFELFINKNYAS